MLDKLLHYHKKLILHEQYLEILMDKMVKEDVVKERVEEYNHLIGIISTTKKLLEEEKENIVNRLS